MLRKTRKPGTGCITQINDHLFEGRYSPTWPDGTKHSKCVYAHTREECEAKLKVLIQQMNAERQALRDQARGITPPDKLTKTQKKIWMYMKFHPNVTSYRAIAKGAGVTRHTASKWYAMMQGMLGDTGYHGSDPTQRRECDLPERPPPTDKCGTDCGGGRTFRSGGCR